MSNCRPVAQSSEEHFHSPQEASELFHVLDVEGRGKISPKSLAKGLQKIDHPLGCSTEDIVAQVFRVMDNDKDGVINVS